MNHRLLLAILSFWMAQQSLFPFQGNTCGPCATIAQGMVESIGDCFEDVPTTIQIQWVVCGRAWDPITMRGDCCTTTLMERVQCPMRKTCGLHGFLYAI